MSSMVPVYRIFTTFQKTACNLFASWFPHNYFVISGIAYKETEKAIWFKIMKLEGGPNL